MPSALTPPYIPPSPLAEGTHYPPTSVELLLSVVSWGSSKLFFPIFLGEERNAEGQKQSEIKGSSRGCSSEMLVGEGLTLSCVSLSHGDGDCVDSLKQKPTLLLILGRLHGIRTQPLRAGSEVGKYLANQCPLTLRWHLGCSPSIRNREWCSPSSHGGQQDSFP